MRWSTSGQADCRVQRALHSHRGATFPGGPSHVYGFINGSVGGPMCGLGWKSLGVLELTALPSIKEETGFRRSRMSTLCWFGAAVPCISVTGCGSPGWPTLAVAAPDMVYVGTSGGAMVATPDFGGATYDDSDPLTGSDRALGLVDFSLFPHLEREDMPDTSLANIEKWAAGLSVPAYAIDDQTAIKWLTPPSRSSPSATRRRRRRPRRQLPPEPVRLRPRRDPSARSGASRTPRGCRLP